MHKTTMVVPLFLLDSWDTIAKTIADLEGEEELYRSHLSEAIRYRSLCREGWLG